MTEVKINQLYQPQVNFERFIKDSGGKLDEGTFFNSLIIWIKDLLNIGGDHANLQLALDLDIEAQRFFSELDAAQAAHAKSNLESLREKLLESSYGKDSEKISNCFAHAISLLPKKPSVKQRAPEKPKAKLESDILERNDRATDWLRDEFDDDIVSQALKDSTLDKASLRPKCIKLHNEKVRKELDLLFGSSIVDQVYPKDPIDPVQKSSLEKKCRKRILKSNAALKAKYSEAVWEGLRKEYKFDLSKEKYTGVSESLNHAEAEMRREDRGDKLIDEARIKKIFNTAINLKVAEIFLPAVIYSRSLQRNLSFTGIPHVKQAWEAGCPGTPGATVEFIRKTFTRDQANQILVQAFRNAGVTKKHVTEQECSGITDSTTLETVLGTETKDGLFSSSPVRKRLKGDLAEHLKMAALYAIDSAELKARRSSKA